MLSRIYAKIKSLWIKSALQYEKSITVSVFILLLKIYEHCNNNHSWHINLNISLTFQSQDIFVY